MYSRKGRRNSVSGLALRAPPRCAAVDRATDVNRTDDTRPLGGSGGDEGIPRPDVRCHFFMAFRCDGYRNRRNPSKQSWGRLTCHTDKERSSRPRRSWCCPNDRGTPGGGTARQAHRVPRRPAQGYQALTGRSRAMRGLSDRPRAVAGDRTSGIQISIGSPDRMTRVTQSEHRGTDGREVNGLSTKG